MQLKYKEKPSDLFNRKREVIEIDDFLKTEHDPKPIDWKETLKGYATIVFIGAVIALFYVALTK